jgi:hypothetical protein
MISCLRVVGWDNDLILLELLGRQLRAGTFPHLAENTDAQLCCLRVKYISPFLRGYYLIFGLAGHVLIRSDYVIFPTRSFLFSK